MIIHISQIHIKPSSLKPINQSFTSTPQSYNPIPPNPPIPSKLFFLTLTEPVEVPVTEPVEVPHRITASPHHRITATPPHRITASPHHCLTASLYHCLTTNSSHMWLLCGCVAVFFYILLRHKLFKTQSIWKQSSFPRTSSASSLTK